MRASASAARARHRSPPDFLVSSQLASFPELPFRTTVIAHTIDVGVLGSRLIGAGWMIASLMFVVVAVTVALRPTGWPLLLPVALVLSTLLCVLGWPEARMGLVMNALHAIGVFTASRLSLPV